MLNNETGIVEENLPELEEYCQAREIYLHIDGVQALGHIQVRMKNFRNVFYTFSAHKFCVPRGCGGIITSEENVLPQLCSGGQESNFRAGTENVAAFAAAALEIALDHLPVVSTRLRDLSGC